MRIVRSGKIGPRFSFTNLWMTKPRRTWCKIQPDNPRSLAEPCAVNAEMMPPVVRNVVWVIVLEC